MNQLKNHETRPSKNKSNSERWTKDRIIGLLLFLPTVILIAAIVVYPLYKIVSLSFLKVDVFLTQQEFIGFENFSFLLKWKEFWNSLLNDITFTGISVILQIIFGVLISLLLNSQFHGNSIVRSIILFPYLLPVVVGVLVWRFILNDSIGVIPYVIQQLDLPFNFAWFASTETAMISVIFVNVWKYFPFMVIVFLAQMQSIDPTLYEVAKVDGANSWQEFWYITFPCLVPVIVIAAMLRSIWHFNDFSLIQLLTAGGPMGTTKTLPVLIYQTVFKQFNLGLGSAIATLMFIILIIMSLIYMKMYYWGNEKAS